MQLSSYRRILTIAMRRVLAYAHEWPRDNWFDCWHAHIDWKSRGRLSAAHRDAELAALFLLHSAIAKVAGNLTRPFHQFVIVNQADPGLDAVFLHTPNPNAKSCFPLVINVDWSKTAPSWLLSHIDPRIERVGRVTGDDRRVNWYVERIDGPNQLIQ